MFTLTSSTSAVPYTNAITPYEIPTNSQSSNVAKSPKITKTIRPCCKLNPRKSVSQPIHRSVTKGIRFSNTKCPLALSRSHADYAGLQRSKHRQHRVREPQALQASGTHNTVRVVRLIRGCIRDKIAQIIQG